jgi:hypothetical protein
MAKNELVFLGRDSPWKGNLRMLCFANHWNVNYGSNLIEALQVGRGEERGERR